jgi:uncharacterized Fe-S center protein
MLLKIGFLKNKKRGIEMKIILLYLILFLFSAILTAVTNIKEKAVVYFTKDISSDGVWKAFLQMQNKIHGNIAIKVHFGEEGNAYFIKPEMMEKLVKNTEATFVETNVLYVSKRRYTESHIELAKAHGFTYAPIDILDAEGDSTLACNTKHYKQVKIGSHFHDYDSYIIFSHFKGHGMAGFGGAIKNVSMGLASISGKMALHASAIPTYRPSSCIQCGECVPECPGGAISINPLVIDKEKCIGCGKCIGICPVRAFGVPWGSTNQEIFLERLVDYASVIVSEKPMIYINVLANISRACDCMSNAPKPFLEDIGILISDDIVAIEKASHDLVDVKCGCDDAFLEQNRTSGKHQIEYAEQIGLGTTHYVLIDLDKE